MDVVGHDGLIRDIRAGRSPSADRLIALLEYLDVKPEADDVPTNRLQGFSEKAAKRIEPSIDGSPEALAKGYLPLPFHRADLAHKDLSHVAFARAHLDGEHLDPDQLSAVMMPNDDMYPAIRPGDLLMIDERFRPEVEPTLCAFTLGSELRVGWLTVPKGGCLVGFFMRTYTPPVVSKGKGPVIECLGRVIARMDDSPEPWIDAGEKNRLVALAKELVASPARG